MVDDNLIELAIRDYNNGRFESLNKAAKAYRQAPSTVKSRYKSNINRQEAHIEQQNLSPIQEDMVVQWILDQEAIVLAPNHSQLREMASLISRLGGGPSQVGKNWIRRFLKRHPQVKTKIGRSLDHKRAQNITKENIQKWYDSLLLVQKMKSIKLDNIWNMDEMGSALSSCSNQTVLGSQDTNSSIIRRPNDREWCTVIECISSAGKVTTQLLIFKAKNVQQQWFIPEDTPDWLYTSSAAAFTTNEIGLKWLKEIYIPETGRGLHEGQWRLLILDGHKSHCTEDFMRYAYTQKVWCYYLIAHASHILQPLDLAVFSSLKRTFRALLALDSEMDDFEPTKKARFIEQYQQARNKAISTNNCKSGFYAAGIVPFNPRKALNSRFVITKPEQRPTTPPPPLKASAALWDIAITPLNRRQVQLAVMSISKNTDLDRTVRTLFAKTGKALDKQQFKIADCERELRSLRRKLANIRSKSKRKQAVNPNELFINLNDICMGSNGPAVPMSTATATQDAPDEAPVVQEPSPVPEQAIRGVIAKLQSISYS